MDRNSALVKNTVLLSIGQFFPKVIAMFTLPILTAYLSKAEYGVYDLANSMVSLIIPLMTLQIQQIAFRYLILAKSNKEKSEYLTSSTVYMLFSSVVFFVIIFACMAFFTEYSVGNILLICFFLISESFYLLAGQFVRGLGSNLKYSIGVVVFAAFQLILTVILVKFFNTGVVGAFLSYSISYILAVFYMLISAKIWNYFNFSSFSIKTMKELITLSAPIVPSSIALWVTNLSDRLIITAVLGVEMNAIYAVANKIPNLFSMAYSTFNLAWTESATIATEDDDVCDYYGKMINQMVSFLVGIMLLLIACTPVLFKSFINEQYSDAYSLMPMLFFGVFFSSIVSFYGAIYVALKRTRQVGVSSVIGAVLNFVINITCIRSIGLTAGALSTALSFFCIVVYRIYDLSKVIKLKYNWAKISFAMVTFVVSAILCYVNNIYSIIGCVIIAIIFNCAENRMLLNFGLGYVKKLLNRG